MKRFVAVLLLSATVAAATAEERRIALADRGFIVLTIPTGWADRVNRPDPQLPPLIEIRPASGPAFEVMITPIWPPSDDMPRVTPEALQSAVRAAAEAVRSQAVEKELPVRTFAGPQGFGAYFSATDRAPKPGEYKYMTQGIFSLAELRVGFTILTNDGRQSVVPMALEMLKNARREPAARRAKLGLLDPDRVK
jgi:hypothetical protein